MKKDDKFYDGKPIYILSFFLGPLIGMYMLLKNEIILKSKKRILSILIVGTIYCTAFFVSIYFFKNFIRSGFLKVLLPFLNAFIMNSYFHFFQRDRIPDDAVYYNWFSYIFGIFKSLFPLGFSILTLSFGIILLLH